MAEAIVFWILMLAFVCGFLAPACIGDYPFTGLHAFFMNDAARISGILVTRYRTWLCNGSLPAGMPFGTKTIPLRCPSGGHRNHPRI